ncbi:FIST C-terminal domain-containing protein [Methanogenium marinum]|uniref:FIST C-terminal domain-containing protein n=1 Tax=Methanogenium marinum TaxID=348610 RepID=A0A9Q4KWB2_9EURY|nr:FIST C-terminal domain-containing protein [Methanogenium marinum]MDE4908931.1 FIST C-terminal domain-containing protein [Methanogenium marinum]
MYINSSATDDVLASAKSLSKGSDDIYTLFFADTDVPDIGELQRELTRGGIRFIGGIAPGLIVGTTVRDCGALIHRYTCAAGPFVVPDPVFGHISSGFVQDMEIPCAGHSTTVMMYLPGHCSATRFLRQIYGMFGNGVTYIGSGMGYEDEILRPCVFSNEIFSDSAAVFVILSSECTVAARHGFIPISDSMVSTLTEQNHVLEINWKNPWNEYFSAIEEDCRREYSGIRPEECIVKYPLVLQTEFPESVCRGVLQVTPEGSLVCAGDIPENAVFRVAKYSYASLVEAAASAAEVATAGLQEKSEFLFLIDCISRKWNCGDKYPCELKAVEQVLSGKLESVQLEGILSFGEISSMGTGMIEYLNYTCVAGRFYE